MCSPVLAFMLLLQTVKLPFPVQDKNLAGIPVWKDII